MPHFFQLGNFTNPLSSGLFQARNITVLSRCRHSRRINHFSLITHWRKLILSYLSLTHWLIDSLTHWLIDNYSKWELRYSGQANQLLETPMVWKDCVDVVNYPGCLYLSIAAQISTKTLNKASFFPVRTSYGPSSH